MGLYGCALRNVLVQCSYFELKQLFVDKSNGICLCWHLSCVMLTA